jgi:hypothetical protein
MEITIGMWFWIFLSGVNVSILVYAIGTYIEEYKKGFRFKPFLKWLIKG